MGKYFLFLILANDMILPAQAEHKRVFASRRRAHLNAAATNP